MSSAPGDRLSAERLQSLRADKLDRACAVFAHIGNQPKRIARGDLESASPGLATEEERAARRASDEALAEQIERGGIAPFVDEWEHQPLFASQSALPDEARAASVR